MVIAAIEPLDSPQVGLRSPELTDSEVGRRITDAALVCFERWGVSKTSVEDVVREAGVSRATFYRYFQGKNHLVLEVVRREATNFFDVLRERLESVESFEELFVISATTAAEFIGGHRVLQVIIEGEPQLLLPHIAFEASAVVEISTNFIAPYIERLAEGGDIYAPDAREVAEWVVRSVLSYLIAPSPRLDMSDAYQVRRLVRDFYLPALARPESRGGAAARKGPDLRSGHR